MPQVREIAHGLRFLEGPAACYVTRTCFGGTCPLNDPNV
jgi:hypothetical protein